MALRRAAVAVALFGCSLEPARDGTPWATGAPDGGSSTGSSPSPPPDTDDDGQTGTSAPAPTITGDADASESGFGTTGADESSSSTGFGECPASAPVEFDAWDDTPWVAPSTGDAQVDFRLSTELWLHYRRFELDLDIDVTDVLLPYQCFLELRNVGAPQNETFPWRYFSICTKNEAPRKLVHVVYAAENDYLTTDFNLAANTTYHVNVVFDAVLDESSVTLTPEGGVGTTVASSPLTSSIVPMGQGLDLLVGFKTSHPDYGTILPPWGWTFRNLAVTMEPGGPRGPLAPACP